MSSAHAAAPSAPTAPDAKPAGGKKKIIVLAVIGVLIAGAVGGGAFMALKGKPAEAQDSKDAKDAKDAKDGKSGEAKRDPKAKPVFVPFESFTVNLADKEIERYAQIIFAIETSDAATGDAVKTHIPAIRGRVLMTLSGKSAMELGGREGKEKLARDILVDARKSMNLNDDDKSLVAVHFSHFVMQ
jgi:flagellar protein FliL